MLKALHRGYFTLEDIATNAKLNPVSIALTFSRLEGVPIELYAQELWFVKLMTFVKQHIKRIEGDPLAGIAYYSAKAGYFEAELWQLFEMQFGRTTLPKSMKNVSLVKTLEAFCQFPGESEEVAWNLEDELTARTKQFVQNGKPSALTFHELSTAVWSLTHLGQDFAELTKYFPALLKVSPPTVGDDCLKFAWALAYRAKLTADLRGELDKVFSASQADCRDSSLKSQAEWAYARGWS
jgi:hypothetical protein